ncbi:MAG TPA: RNB domain-containing ribonuclease [Actinomycetota bacterium]|nr:RNB domain-containing ribonuclease [Actinomycetota bacterium]
MTARRVRLAPEARELVDGFERIRAAMHLPAGFPPDVERELGSLPDPTKDPSRRDATEIGFVTIDPPGSRDLDQAFHAQRNGAGYLVHYAIADVAAFVAPGSALDRESHRRGQTLYSPDRRVPVYPPEVSEGVASLLPTVTRPAVLWSLELDARGTVVDVVVERANVVSSEQLSYEQVQHSIDDRDAGPSLLLLQEIGRLRQKIERERGGISLHLPEQEVVRVGASYELAYRAPLPVEDWNAQISLMTGMAAAEIMIEGGIGLLRTMPPPDAETIAMLRRSALALGLQWPDSMSYRDFVNTLDASKGADAAIVTQAARLFRGVNYVAFDGTAPTDAIHHAIAAPYAHVTAPLRRMADRYATEVCLAVARGQRPPEWCVAALAALPEEMKEADRRAGELERRVVDLVEAVVLSDHVGEVFDAVVIGLNKNGGTIQLRDPAVVTSCDGERFQLGAPVRARLIEADPVKGRLRFEAV